MFKTLAIAALGAVFAADAVYAHAFIGCFDRASDRTYLGIARDGPACANFAADRGFKVSHYKTFFKQCYGSNNGNAQNTYRTGYPTSCPSTSFNSYAVGSPYDWVMCPWSVEWHKSEAMGLGRDFNSAADCLATCASKKSRYAVTMPGEMGVPSKPPMLRCFCARYLPDVKSSQCATNGFFMYDAGPQWDVVTPPTPQPSLSSKRRAEAAARLVQEEFFAANPVCPPTTRACNVSENPDDGYECINVDEELESCGGCRFGSYLESGGAVGVNCLTVPGINPLAVTCDAGTCKVGACAEGYESVDGNCV